MLRIISIFDYNNIMNEKSIKILFSGITDNIKEEIEMHLSGAASFYEFCDLENTDASIKEFRPHILITAISASLSEYQVPILELKLISETFSIPFAIIVNKSNDEPYQFLIKNNITKIITTPVKKQDFLDYIYSFICREYPDEFTDGKDTFIAQNYCNEAENSLISNLVTQNKMVSR